MSAVRESFPSLAALSYTASLLFYNTLMDNASSEASNAKCAPVTGIALGARRKGNEKSSIRVFLPPVITLDDRSVVGMVEQRRDVLSSS